MTPRLTLLRATGTYMAVWKLNCELGLERRTSIRAWIRTWELDGNLELLHELGALTADWNLELDCGTGACNLNWELKLEAWTGT